jgi:Fe-S-cluster-containing hydrogenase component 2
MAEKLKPGRKPCTHCGECCRQEICPIGEIFMRTTEPPCPALVKNPDTNDYWCGLITRPEKTMYVRTYAAEYWAPIFAKYLEENAFHFGAGCDNY